jgi:hypothetical protein
VHSDLIQPVIAVIFPLLLYSLQPYEQVQAENQQSVYFCNNRTATSLSTCPFHGIVDPVVIKAVQVPLFPFGDFTVVMWRRELPIRWTQAFRVVYMQICI